MKTDLVIRPSEEWAFPARFSDKTYSRAMRAKKKKRKKNGLIVKIFKSAREKPTPPTAE